MTAPEPSAALSAPAARRSGSWISRLIQDAFGFCKHRSWPVEKGTPTLNAKEREQGMRFADSRQEIQEKLSAAGALDECIRCHAKKVQLSPIPPRADDVQNIFGGIDFRLPPRPPLQLMDGFVSLQMQEDATKPDLSRSYIPCAAVVCMKCGFVNLHSIGALGIASKP